MGFNNSLTFGYDYMNSKENIKNKSVFFGFASEGEFDLEKMNYGYYFHDEFKLLDNLALSAGYRHDRAEFNFDPSTPDHATMDKDLYTGGINYNFLEKSHVYFSFSRSFRYPALDELFNFFTNTIDPGLVPQTSDDYEAGVRHYFTENLRAGINFFRIDTEDEIYYDPYNFANDNLDGKTRRDGMEVSINKIYKSVTLGGSYTYIDATIMEGQYEGKDVPSVPQHKATLETLFSLGRGFMLGINGIYIGERLFIGDFSNDFSNQEDYIVVNAKLMHNWKYLSSFLNINNITNEEYTEYGAIGGFPVEEAFYPSLKINFLLGMSASF
jgi:iron complex outermembrane receptor protein